MPWCCNVFHQFKKNIPQTNLYCKIESVLMFPQLKWCCNLFSSVPKLSHTYAVMLQLVSSVQKKKSKDKFILQNWISSDVPTVKVMLQLVFISSKIVPHLCRDVATFFISSKNIPQSKWHCNFESVLMFPQLKWCCNLFSSVPKLSHTYAVMLQLVSSVQRNIPQSKWHCNFESVLIFPQLKWCCIFFISSEIVPHLCPDVATFFISSKNIPQSKWYCNFESVLIFPQLCRDVAFFSSVPKLSHTYALMLQLVSSVQKTSHSQSDIATLNQFWFSHSYAVMLHFFHQFRNCPTLMPWCCNLFHQFKKHPTVKVILQLWISSDFPTVMPWCCIFFISSEFVPHLCRDVATFFISSKNIPQSNWYCNFESVLIFPQSKWHCIFSISSKMFPHLFLL